MRITFKCLLKRYYHRAGNRIIFSNGHTLNQLALMMSEKLNSSFDPATLSRVVAGKRLFTALQLRAFSTVLNIPSSERLTLTKSLAISVLARVHIKRTLLYKKSLYTKFLEFVIKEPHAYTRLLNNTEGTSLVLDVLGKIEEGVKNKYPLLWKYQKQALLGCEVQSAGRPHYFLFRP